MKLKLLTCLLLLNTITQAQYHSAKFSNRGISIVDTAIKDNMHTFTTECWIKRKSNIGYQTIIQDSTLFGMYFKGDTLTAYIGRNINVYSIKKISTVMAYDNDWHMIAFEYQYNSINQNYTLSLYTDNNLDTSITSSFQNTYPYNIASANMFIACSNNLNDSVFKGDIYKLNVYNLAYPTATGWNFQDTCSIVLNYLYSFFSKNVDSVYYKSDTAVTFIGNLNTYNSPCNDTVITTGIINKGTADIDVYPNPVENYISIKSPVIIEKVEILNLLGQVILFEKPNRSNLQIGLYDLKKGVYILIVNDNFIKKIIKD